MKKIQWEENMTPEQQDLHWAREFIQKPFDERFSYLCKLQMMGRKQPKPNDRQKKRIEWKP
ncbi:hypothetical protein JKA74_11595 [Marivirga sp. S37H4]|uniref:Uncharacterized protein n=1 Tax=Marivirga aurantiaca TaxID=2802615 RepID=A0A934WZD4_9BACT|nr:hypothetical protein [Marivirga aurantiaca]MBK6265682.1 hypothetical protein [Marivirga aurantiaca]